MKKAKAQKDILYISISSFILVVVWIGSNIYHAHVTSTITPDLQIKILPIDPDFDASTIQNLKSRERIIPVYEISGADITPSPTVELDNPTSSGSAELLIEPPIQEPVDE